jgi:hypothetical protein
VVTAPAASVTRRRALPSGGAGRVR